MKKLMGLILSVALLMGLLAGCAGTPKENNETTTPPTTTEASTPETSGTAEAAWPRTITDARGKEVTIEKKPERVAAGDWMIAEQLLALDMPPVASTSATTMANWASMKEYFEKYHVEDLGSETDLNLEKLLDSTPDLILASKYNEKMYDALEKIAPVIVLESFDTYKKDNIQNGLNELAMIIGEEAEAETFIRDATAQIEEARDKLSSIEKTVAFINIWDKNISAVSTSQLDMYYSKDLGIGLTAPSGWTEETGVISLEVLTELNPDYIFYAAASDYIDEIKETSVWKSLAAVKENHVYPIDTSGLTGGPLSLKYGVQVIVDAMTE